jgi:thiol-disulfide isomerase/thioredoxin
MNIKQLMRMAIMLGLVVGATMTKGADQSEGKALKVGDPAPKLQVAKWVQGEAVKEFDRDHAYIVEFWATWCPPCIASIPHLNDIYVKFKDKGLVVIGQNAWERDLKKVTPFVEKMADKMTYRVALDLVPEGEETGRMAATWMEAAGLEGIPAAFLIDKQGKIAWLGHPMTLKEKTIEQVLAGTYDLQKAAAEAAKQKENEAQLAKLSPQLAASLQEKDWVKAEATVAEIEKLLPEDERAGLVAVRIRIFVGKEDFKGAFKLAEQLSDAHKEEAELQNEIAWFLATDSAVKNRNLSILEKIATRANDAAKAKDPAILDTLARVYFLQDKKDKAIETQEKAIKLAQGQLKEQLEATLESYKQGKLPADE